MEIVKQCLTKTKIYNKNKVEFVMRFFEIPIFVTLNDFCSDAFYSYKYQEKASQVEKERKKN